MLLVQNSIHFHSTVRKTISSYTIYSRFVNRFVMNNPIFQAHIMFSLNKSTDKGDFQFVRGSQREPAVVMKKPPWASYNIPTLSSFQIGYGRAALHLSKQVYPAEPSLEEFDIVSYAKSLRLSLEQPLSLHVQTEIYPIQRVSMQRHCHSFALSLALNKVFGGNIALDDEQLSVGQLKGLDHFSFRKTSNIEWEREGKLHL